MLEAIFITQLEQPKETSSIRVQPSSLEFTGETSLVLRQDAVLKNQDLDKTVENIYQQDSNNMLVLLLDSGLQFIEQNDICVERFYAHLKKLDKAAPVPLPKPARRDQRSPPQKPAKPIIKKIEVSIYGIYKDEVVDLSQAKLVQIKALKDLQRVTLNSGEQLESLLQQAYKNIQNYQKILHLGGEFPLNYFIEFHLTPKGTTVCFARLFVDIVNQPQVAEIVLSLLGNAKNQKKKTTQISKLSQQLSKVLDKQVVLVNQVYATETLLQLNLEQSQFVRRVQVQLGEDVQPARQPPTFDQDVDGFIKEFQNLQYQFQIFQLLTTIRNLENALNHSATRVVVREVTSFNFNSLGRTSSFSFKNKENHDTRLRIEDQKEKLREKKDMIRQLQEKLDEMEMLYKEHEDTFELYKRKARDSKKKTKTLLNQYKEENMALVQQQNDEQVKIKKVLNEYRESQEELIQLSAEFERYRSECAEHLRKCLEEESHRFEKVCRANDRKIQELESERFTLQNDKQQLQSAIEHQKIDFQRILEEQVQTKHIAQQHSTDLSNENQQLVARIQDAEKERKKVAAALEQLQSGLKNDTKQTQREREQQIMKIRSLEQELQETKELLIIQDRKQEKQSSLAVKQQQEELHRLRDELKAKKQKHKAEKVQVKDLHLKLQQADASLDLAKQSQASLKDTLIQQERRVGTLEEQLSQKDRYAYQLENERQTLTQQLQKLGNDKLSLEQHIANCEARFNEREYEISQLDLKLQEERRLVRELRQRAVATEKPRPVEYASLRGKLESHNGYTELNSKFGRSIGSDVGPMGYRLQSQ